MSAVLSAMSQKWGTLERQGIVRGSGSTLKQGTKDLHLLKKSPKDSFVRLTLPLSSSYELRESMLNARGHLRVGRLLEELDSFAGCIAQLHVDDGNAEVAPPLLVTAAFDRIDNLLAHPIPATEDITLEGCVTFAGRSSLNIAMDVLVGGGEGRVP